MTTEKGTIFVLPNQMGFAGAADQMPRLEPVNLHIFTVTTQPLSQAGGDRHEGKAEGGREASETTAGGKHEMREAAPVDKIKVHGTTTSDRDRVRESATRNQTGVEGAAASTLSTEGSVTNTVPTTTESMPEQNH